jgi:hypothetical protein
MTTHGFVKQEAFTGIFDNGMLGTEELIDVLYPNRVFTMTNSAESGDAEARVYDTFSMEAQNLNTLGEPPNVAGVFPNSYRNNLISNTVDGDELSSMVAALLSSKGRKKKSVSTPDLGIINTPFPTVKSRLGELVTIVTDAPPSRMPGENKHIVKEPISIPTHNATQRSESIHTRPQISIEADIVPFAGDQVYMEALDEIDPDRLDGPVDVRYSTDKLLDFAKRLHLGVNAQIKREQLAAGIKEVLVKYGRF